MRAWMFTGTHEPLVRAELPDPVPAPSQVVVDVRAAGLCHSDVGLLDDPGWTDLLVRTPIAPGHEVAGVVSAVGDDVTDWHVGARVALCPTTSAAAPGYKLDGGFAERVVIGQQALVALPDGVSFAQGAAATDAGMTSYHAMVVRGGVTAGTRVGVIGLGGLGQFGARAAVLRGAQVHVADTDEKVHDLAYRLGATRVSTSVTDFADADLDVVVDYAGFGDTTAQAVETVRPGGRVVLVGMGRLETTVSTMALIMGRVELVGSRGGTPDDVRAVLDLYATGDLDPVITEITWEDIPRGLDDLRAGTVLGRLVAVYDD